MKHPPPLTVEVIRGPAVESRHVVHAVLMNGRGKITAAFGDPKRPTFPRSSIKPLQALALVETGAADAFDLSEAELALACASHSGEEKHTAAVAGWLGRLGLDFSCLECGAHAPYAHTSAPAEILCNNCSGKHAGMLTLSLFMKTPHIGYTYTGHPVQQAILKSVGDMCGVNINPLSCGIDGCSAPNPLLSLKSIAQGFASFMNPKDLSPVRKEACHRLLQAMVRHPDLVGGTGRLDTLLMGAANGKIMSKTGAEGVYVCVVPEQDTVLVLKAEDGSARASQAALFTLLEKHRLAEAAVLDAIRPVALPSQSNWRGLETGQIKVMDFNSDKPR